MKGNMSLIRKRMTAENQAAKAALQKNITMKIIYKSYMARLPQTLRGVDWEVREAVKTALALVEGKRVQKPIPRYGEGATSSLPWDINIYTTSIEDTTTRVGRIRRRELA